MSAASLASHVAPAHADGIADYARLEVGAGYAQQVDVSDGVWWQQGAAQQSIDLRSPALLAGLTGTAYAHGNWSLDWHADYVYMGTVTASCVCVPDANYDPHAHVVHGVPDYESPFGGAGHTQGIALTLSPGYAWNGWRVGAEAGPWVFWQTWHEQQVFAGTTPMDMSHRTQAQLGWVAGLRVERGAFGLSARYYDMPQKWNPYPGISRGAYVIMGTWRF
jgi:hypothetical protein